MLALSFETCLQPHYKPCSKVYDKLCCSRVEKQWTSKLERRCSNYWRCTIRRMHFKDRYAIVMEPVAGMDLKWYLYGMKEAPQVREEISQWYGCLINALAFLHETGINHGEINPTHILISNNSVLLTCSTHSSSLDYHIATTTTTITPRGSNMYRPPESFLYLPAGSWSDIFSLGCVHRDVCWHPTSKA